ncbi:cupin [Shouchella miscanthi]|uniref:Cupin n=1 Tax=Shouchella miscanthi TaxID=2598861 RepID=A0ABU6NNU0_9BACI|nr:cupin [Shouchella miscanthi]
MNVVELTGKHITHYQSNVLSFPLALTKEATHIQLMALQKGNKIGMHRAATPQRLYCVSGLLEVRNEFNLELVKPFHFVEWERGELHETLALEDAQIIVIETISFS